MESWTKNYFVGWSIDLSLSAQLTYCIDFLFLRGLLFWLIPWFIQISGSGCWILISNLKYLIIPLLSYGPPERLPTSAFAAGFKVAPLPWAMGLSSGTDRYEVVTWTGELPTFLDFLAPARKRLPYGGDWAPWIPFPFRISLTYGTERHTEAEIKKRLGFPTPFFVFRFLPRVPSLGCSLTTIKIKHWDGYRWATYVLCWTLLTFFRFFFGHCLNH